MAIGLGVWAITLGGSAEPTIRAMAFAGMGVSIFLGRGIIVIQQTDSGVTDQQLTLATGVTITRGLIAGGTAGAVAMNIAWWVPVGLLTIAALLDAVDGYLARVRDAVTEIGAKLDTEADGTLVLVAAVLVVAQGYTPVLLLVGAARYLYLGGCWIVRQFEKPIYTDPQETLNKGMYILMLTALLAAMIPVDRSGMFELLLWAVATVFLLNFLRSWLVAIRPTGTETSR